MFPVSLTLLAVPSQHCSASLSLPWEVTQQVKVTTPLGLAGEPEAESTLPCLGSKEAQSQKHPLPLGAHSLAANIQPERAQQPPASCGSEHFPRTCVWGHAPLPHQRSQPRLPAASQPGPEQTSRGICCPCFECPCYSVLLFTGQ